MKMNYFKAIVVALLSMIFATAVTFSADELSNATFKIDTKDKGAKVKVETVVNMLKGVTEAEFDLNTKKLQVKFDPMQIELSMIQFAIESMGYPVTVVKEKKEENQSKRESRDSTKK